MEEPLRSWNFVAEKLDRRNGRFAIDQWTEVGW
jgi:hypothetical protein